LDNGTDPVPVATTLRTGLVPILSGNSSQFLNGAGSWSAPQTQTQAQWYYRTILSMADPGSGNLRFNNALAGSTTQIAISKLSAAGNDRYYLLMSLQYEDVLLVEDATNAANWIRYSLSAVPTDNTTWFLLPVTVITGSGTSPSNNDLLTLTFTIGGAGGVTGTVNPGTWTNLSYGTGWTQNTVAQYRVETNGSFQEVICQGIINYASGAASLAFTLPAGARPSVQRGCMLAGYDSTGDVQSFLVTISTAGAVNIYPMVRQAFVWPSATNGSVYLDNLSFAL
jgi:hypothetical protein